MPFLRRTPRALIVIALLCAGPAPASRARSSGAGTDAAVAEVRALLHRQEADWNRGDLEAFLGGYWKSPKLVFQSGGVRHEGWEATRERYLRRYKAEGRSMGRVAFADIEVVPLAADAVLARGSWRLELPDGSRPGGLFTLVLKKFPEGWRIVHDHTSMAETPREKP
jgi:beta-aspartyl-peptidase (threonine type)